MSCLVLQLWLYGLPERLASSCAGSFLLLLQELAPLGSLFSAPLSLHTPISAQDSPLACRPTVCEGSLGHTGAMSHRQHCLYSCLNSVSSPYWAEHA